MSQVVEGLKKIRRPVQIWLLIGCLMVFVQVVIGGVTRLTDSGLSITEWAVIQGTLPPMNLDAWTEAFDLYKVHAKKQFESLHADMTLSEFKVIFFWEYFHRLWARLMGFVFLFPFLAFWFMGWLPKWLMKRLGIVILIAVIVALFGWIMVASGLNDDNRTWVSAYKLVTHLGLATLLFGYLFWTWLRSFQGAGITNHAVLRNRSWWLLGFLSFQIVLGGLMAGMRAGLIHPHWPLFVNGGNLWNAMMSLSSEEGSLINYEGSVGVKAWVQVFHRLTAYFLAGLVIWWLLQVKKLGLQILVRGSIMFSILLVIQVFLGIITVVMCKGGIPVLWGAMHQGLALILISSLLYVIFQLRKDY
ncbi:MAG: COX15/CtaA family protein [Saprospiraceae bacterium]|nr:COX15/CtaA family protein [Saprospiraceae bacterium]